MGLQQKKEANQKKKVSLCLCTPWRYIGKWRYSSTHSEPKHMVEVSGQLHAFSIFLKGMTTGTHWIGSWVGHTAGLKKKNSCPFQDLSGSSSAANPTVQSL